MTLSKIILVILALSYASWSVVQEKHCWDRGGVAYWKFLSSVCISKDNKVIPND